MKKTRSVAVTSHGEPVAKTTSADQAEKSVERARAVLFSRLRKQHPVNAGRLTREELYDGSSPRD